MPNKKIEELEEESVVKEETELSKSGRVFLFPKDGIAISAKTREEAQKKYEEQLSKPKEKE